MATLYGRAGGGNWSDAATWSLSSGGGADGSVPTAADEVILDAASGNVTIDSGANRVCRSLDCNGYTGTLANTASGFLRIGDGTAATGNRALRFSAGMTYTQSTGEIHYIGTSGTAQTVTTAGKTVYQFCVYAGSCTLSDGLAVSNQLLLDAGTFNTNSQTVSAVLFAFTSSTAKTLTLGSSAVTLTLAGAAVAASAATNLTVTANTATFTLNGTNGQFQGGATNWNGLTVAFTGDGAAAWNGNCTVGAITRTGTAVKTDTFVWYTAGTVTGTFTVTGNSATNRVLVASNTLGTARTITAAAVALTNVDFRDITGAGAATWSGTSVGNALGNSNITFTTPVTRYAVATGNVSGTGTWSATSGGASGASVPLCQDTMVLNAASGAITVTNDMPRMCADLTCTGYTGTLAFGATTVEIYGSPTLGSGMTLTGSGLVGLYGRSTHTITSAGKSWSIYMRIFAGNYSLNDALSITRNTSGDFYAQGISTFNDNGFSITCYSFYGVSTVTLSGTTTIVAGVLTDPWFSSTGTLNHTGTIVLSGATATDRTFAGGGKTYGTLTDQNTSTGKLTITGQNTFGTINKTAAAACTLALPTSSGITVTGQFNVQGTSTATLTLTGDVTKASGLVECDFMSISNSDATGGAKFYAPNSTDGGSNTGWIFTAAPTPTSTGMLSIVYQLNRLAGTSGLEMAGAANAWAGTSGLEVVGALNARLRQVDSNHTGGLEMNGVCRQLAIKLGGEGTYDAPRALASIPT